MLLLFIILFMNMKIDMIEYKQVDTIKRRKFYIYIHIVYYIHIGGQFRLLFAGSSIQSGRANIQFRNHILSVLSDSFQKIVVTITFYGPLSVAEPCQTASRFEELKIENIIQNEMKIGLN